MHLIYSSYHSILSANCLCIIASLFFSADAFKQSPLGQQDHSPLDHSFNEIVHAKLSQYHAPGVAVAVVQDKLVTAKGYGIASFPSTPVTPSTLFYTASTTKAFVSAAWALFVSSPSNQNKSSGKITFSTPLSSIIRDDFVLEDEYATNHVTIEDALSHRTGMGAHDLWLGGKIDSLKKLVSKMRYLPMTSELRTRYEYCNIMVATAGYAFEVITGRWLGDFLREEIWEPLGMNTTVYSFEDAQKKVKEEKAVLAKPYLWDEEKGQYIEGNYLQNQTDEPAGNMISNVLDYAEWIKMLIHKDSPLGDKVVEEVTRPRTIVGKVEVFDGITTYALGWNVVIYKGERVFLHTGGETWYASIVLWLPDKKWGITIMGNSLTASGHVQLVLAFHLLDEFLGTPQEERYGFDESFRKELEDKKAGVSGARQILYPSAPSPPLPRSLPLSSYNGTYDHPAYQNITFGTQSDTPNSTRELFADVPDRQYPFKLRMEHVSGEFWIAYFVAPVTEFEELPIKAEFRIGEDGKVKELGIIILPETETAIWFKKIGD